MSDEAIIGAGAAEAGRAGDGGEVVGALCGRLRDGNPLMGDALGSARTEQKALPIVTGPLNRVR